METPVLRELRRRWRWPDGRGARSGPRQTSSTPTCSTAPARSTAPESRRTFGGVPQAGPGSPCLMSVRTGPPTATGRTLPSRAPGLLMGLGFGGFVDGIVLHQILQWHHMISDNDEHARHHRRRSGGEHAGRRLVPPAFVFGVVGRRTGAARPTAAQWPAPSMTSPRRVAVGRVGRLQRRRGRHRSPRPAGASRSGRLSPIRSPGTLGSW